jgi:hypothetical protein
MFCLLWFCSFRRQISQPHNMPPTIDPWIEKGLAQALEESGKSRTDLILRDLCDKNTQLFGEKGTPTRRKVQVAFANIKRKSARSWCVILDKYKIPYGPVTTRELREQATQPSPESSVADSTEADNEPSPPESVLPPPITPTTAPTISSASSVSTTYTVSNHGGRRYHNAPQGIFQGYGSISDVVENASFHQTEHFLQSSNSFFFA